MRMRAIGGSGGGMHALAVVPLIESSMALSSCSILLTVTKELLYAVSIVPTSLFCRGMTTIPAAACASVEFGCRPRPELEGHGAAGAVGILLGSLFIEQLMHMHERLWRPRRPGL